MRNDPGRHRSLHLFEALSRLAETAARASVLSEVFQESLDCLERTLGSDRAAILLFDPDGVMRFKASRNLSESYCRKVEGHSPWSRDEKSPVPLLVPDVSSQPDFEAYRETILHEGIRALAFIPIFSGGALLGKLMVYYNEPNPFSTEEIQIAQVVAAQIAFGVERTRAEQTLTQDPEIFAGFLENVGLRKLAERRLAAEHAVTRILAESQSLSTATPRILQALGECLGCVFAGFWRLEPGASVIHCTDTWQSPAVSLGSFDEMSRGLTFERGRGIPGRVWQNGTPVWISDLSADDNFPRLGVAKSVGLKSAFAFPIRVAGRFLGVMEFFLIHRSEPDERLIAMMAAIGSEIGQFMERRQAEEALASSEAITRSIIDTALDAVITMDSRGIVMAWNRQSEALFGWPAAEAVGRPLAELIIPERYRAAHRRGLEQYRENGTGRILDRRVEIEGMRRDGTEFPVELTVTAIEAGDSYWFSAFLRDITARKKEEGRLRHESQVKDDFLAMLAHELRNPLNPIRSAVHVMKQVGTSEPILDRARGIIDRQVRHMARIVDDLLDVSRISRGMILIRKERVDLIELVRATFEDHRAEIEESAQTVILDLPDTPIWVSGDPTRLAQIVGNILQNATKFTDAGGTIRVRARCEPETSQVVLSVRDSGVGIERHMLERVFETFTQADRTLDHRNGGLGLGLALVKGLVGLHGGSVRATSEGRGQGTEFSIRLPLSSAPPPEPKPAASEGALGGSCRVLVIEDHADSSEGVALLLRLNGHVVKLARTGSEGLAYAREFLPDVVLCDIGLDGGMDGYAVARNLRSEPRFAGTYLVAVTGFGSQEDIHRSREAGFDLHLTKPFDPKALQTTLRELAARLPAIRA